MLKQLLLGAVLLAANGCGAMFLMKKSSKSGGSEEPSPPPTPATKVSTEPYQLKDVNFSSRLPYDIAHSREGSRIKRAHFFLETPIRNFVDSTPVIMIFHIEVGCKFESFDSLVRYEANNLVMRPGYFDSFFTNFNSTRIVAINDTPEKFGDNLFKRVTIETKNSRILNYVTAFYLQRSSSRYLTLHVRSLDPWDLLTESQKDAVTSLLASFKVPQIEEDKADLDTNCTSDSPIYL